jgi:hypothetical protein
MKEKEIVGLAEGHHCLCVCVCGYWAVVGREQMPGCWLSCARGAEDDDDGLISRSVG